MKNTRLKYWSKEIDNMLEGLPESCLTQNRKSAIRYLLKDVYPEIAQIPKAKMLEIIGDLLYLDRKLRQVTEGQQDVLKQRLSVEKQIELGYGIEIKKIIT